MELGADCRNVGRGSAVIEVQVALTELGVALVGGKVGGGDAASDAVGVPPAALAEAREPLVPRPAVPVVEDPADLVDGCNCKMVIAGI